MPAPYPPVFGEGTILEINDGAGAAFVAVDDLTDNLSPPGSERMRVDRKRLSQTAYRERVTTLRDLGESSFTYEMKYANFARMEGLVTANVPKSFRITYPDGTRMAFTGTLYSNRPGPVSGEQIATATCGVVVQSLVTLTDNTPE